MKKKYDVSGIILASVTAIVLLCIIIVRAFFPRIILPDFDISLMLPITLVSLIIEHYFVREKKRDFRLIPIYAALVFGVFPLAGLISLPLDALKSCLIGAALVSIVTFLFDSISDRLAGEHTAKFAPIISAIGLYLAAGCLFGIIK